GICEPAPETGDGRATWLGHGAAAAYGLGILLVIFIYVGKRWITRLALNAPATILCYCLGIVCSLPYIWFLFVVDWQNEFVLRVACWIYYPIGIWFVPTASFAWDVMSRTPCTGQAYFARSVIEVVVVIPIWLQFWVFVSFFLLGGGWI